MSRATVLAMGRRAAQASMVDRCVITRVVTTALNPATGAVVPTPATVYLGPCRLQAATGYGRNAIPSPVDDALMHYRILQLPVADSEGVLQGDQVVITACVNDPDLVGVQMVVRDQDTGKTEATVRRLGVDEVTG